MLLINKATLYNGPYSKYTVLSRVPKNCASADLSLLVVVNRLCFDFKHFKINMYRRDLTSTQEKNTLLVLMVNMINYFVIVCRVVYSTIICYLHVFCQTISGKK
jgi:hypothetical protein